MFLLQSQSFGGGGIHLQSLWVSGAVALASQLQCLKRSRLSSKQDVRGGVITSLMGTGHPAQEGLSIVLQHNKSFRRVNKQGQLLEGVECHIYLYCFTFDDINLNRVLSFLFYFQKNIAIRKCVQIK